jgi:hypothetical protein
VAYLISGGMALYELISGGVGLSGPYFYLLGKNIPEGNPYPVKTAKYRFVNWNFFSWGYFTLGDHVMTGLLLVQMIVFVMMQALVELQKRKLKEAQVVSSCHRVKTHLKGSNWVKFQWLVL